MSTLSIRNQRLGWAAILGVLLFQLPQVYAQQPLQIRQQREQQEFYGLPKRLTNLGDLTPIIYRQDMTRLQKTDVLLTWLVEERNDPSPTSIGGGGGPIDSGYIQAQLIKGLSQFGDPQALNQLSSLPRLTDNTIYDVLHISLGMMGDKRQVSVLRTILAHHSEPDLRALAAEALQNLGAIEAIPDLQQALKDDFSAPAVNSLNGTYTCYPVREAAAQALKAIHQMEFVVSSHDRSRKFVLRLDEERKSAVISQTLMNKLIATVNKGKQTRIARGSTPKQ